MPEVSLDALLADPRRAAEVSPRDAERLTVELAALIVALSARRAAASNGSPTPELGTPGKLKDRDTFLDLDEMVARSHKSRGWFLAHWRREFPRAVKKGRTILVPEVAFAKWLQESDTA